MGCHLLSHTPSFPNSICVRCSMKPMSECRAHARLHHSVLGSSPAAPDQAGTSSRPIPRASPPATRPGPLLNLLEAHPVHTGCTRIGAGESIRVTQNVFTADLVVEHIEAESRLRLRLAVELSRSEE